MTRIATLDETPEQVLARLERHAASLRRAALARGTVARTRARLPAPAPAPVYVYVRVPPPGATSQELRRIGIEAMGPVVGLACCVAAIFAFQLLDRAVAAAIVAGFVLGGALAAARRFPLAGGGHWASRSAASSHSCRDRRDVAVHAPLSAVRGGSRTRDDGDSRGQVRWRYLRRNDLDLDSVRVPASLSTRGPVE